MLVLVDSNNIYNCSNYWSPKPCNFLIVKLSSVQFQSPFFNVIFNECQGLRNVLEIPSYEEQKKENDNTTGHVMKWKFSL